MLLGVGGSGGCILYLENGLVKGNKRDEWLGRENGVENGEKVEQYTI